MSATIFIFPARAMASAMLLIVGLNSVSAGLTFDNALRLAESRTPQVQAREQALTASQSARKAAGALPDPKLFAGIDNLPVSGPNRYSLTRDFMTMQKIGVMQEVPNQGKRTAARRLADATVTKSQTELAAEQLKARREAALAWLALYYLQQKLALLDEIDYENRLLTASVTAQLAGGQASALEALVPKQELIALADRRDALEGELAKARAALTRWVGEAANELLSGEPPKMALPEAHLRQALSHHPELAVYGSQEDAARAEVAMAQAAKQPDWAVELAYQRRDPDFGDMVSVQFTFDLPVFTKTRQAPLIAARQRELERVTAEREAQLRQHTEELEGLLTERTALDRQVKRIDHDWLPLAQQAVELTTAAYQAGREPLVAVLDARKALIDTRMKHLDLESQRAQVDARLRYLAGEERP